MIHSLFVNQRGATERRDADRGMGRVRIILVGVVVLAVIGGCLYLAYGNFPVTTTTVEKVLPDARFPK